MHVARLGISSCLLGERVRWDGGHKRNEDLLAAYAGKVEWVPICPERELGLGVPREPIHLRRDAAGERLVGVHSGRDLGAAMDAYAAQRARELLALDLDGYVLKSRSPSCGLQGLPIHDASGTRVLSEDGVGRFAAELRRALPELVLVEERQLERPAPREVFLACAAALRRWKHCFAASSTRAELRRWLDDQAPALRAVDPEAVAELAVALESEREPAALERACRARFARAMARVVERSVREG